eukprot:5342756-Amphidinium_carterae.1
MTFYLATESKVVGTSSSHSSILDTSSTLQKLKSPYNLRRVFRASAFVNRLPEMHSAADVALPHYQLLAQGLLDEGLALFHCRSPEVSLQAWMPSMGQ